MGAPLAWPSASQNESSHGRLAWPACSQRGARSRQYQPKQAKTTSLGWTGLLRFKRKELWRCGISVGVKLILFFSLFCAVGLWADETQDRAAIDEVIAALNDPVRRVGLLTRDVDSSVDFDRLVDLHKVPVCWRCDRNERALDGLDRSARGAAAFQVATG
jgi:hypothetical protein